jgi:hypothetical protein
MLVCDRCGAPEGTCEHQWDESDYVLESKERYDDARRVLQIFWWCMVLITAILFAWSVI